MNIFFYHLSNETPIEGVVIEVFVVVKADAEVEKSVDVVSVTIFVSAAIVGGVCAVLMILGLESDMVEDLIDVVV